jgi:DNA polymerase kappa
MDEEEAEEEEAEEEEDQVRIIHSQTDEEEEDNEFEEFINQADGGSSALFYLQRQASLSNTAQTFASSKVGKGTEGSGHVIRKAYSKDYGNDKVQIPTSDNLDDRGSRSGHELRLHHQQTEYGEDGVLNTVDVESVKSGDVVKYDDGNLIITATSNVAEGSGPVPGQPRYDNDSGEQRNKRQQLEVEESLIAQLEQQYYERQQHQQHRQAKANDQTDLFGQSLTSADSPRVELLPQPSQAAASSSSSISARIPLTATATEAAQSEERVPQFHFSHNKAGMENVDKQRMERIIAEVSKGNPYYEKAAKTDQKVREKAAILKKKAENLTPKELSVAEFEVNKRVAYLEKTCRDLTQCYVCIDMDQFFVAVEMRDNPKLRGLPVAVGPTLISTASYEARKFGVRSAMPTFIAKKLCPELVVVPGRYEAYGEASKRAQAVFADYDETFSAMSLDEAFLNITPLLKGKTLASNEGIITAEEIVSELRKKVFEATRGLTCSAGIAPNRMLAKICSEKNKPNGQFTLKAELPLVLSFIRELPVRKVPGIGKASELLLAEGFNIKTCQDLWDQRYVLKKCMTPALCDFYLRVPIACTSGSEGESTSGTSSSSSKAPGFFGFVDSQVDEESYERKSISIERTFRAIGHERDLRDKLRLLCDSLAEEISNKNCFGRTLTLKLKTDEFEVRTRGETLKTLFGGKQITGQFLYRITEPLLRQELPIKARLMGLRISNLAMEAPLNFDASVYEQPVLDRFLSAPPKQDNSPHEARVTLESKTYCPICSKDLTRLSNDDINAHIDGCLNRNVVLDIIKAQNDLDSRDSSITTSSKASISSAHTANAPSSKTKIESYFKKRC